jgi:hypothetical protein
MEGRTRGVRKVDDVQKPPESPAGGQVSSLDFGEKYSEVGEKYSEVGENYSEVGTNPIKIYRIIGLIGLPSDARILLIL